MSLCAIVPIKPLRRGKSRLSSVLSEQNREGLNQYLLNSTLDCLSNIPEIDQIIVVSYDPTVLTLARKYGVRTVLESRNSNINRALRKATIAAVAVKATKVLIVPADIPFLNKSSIYEVIGMTGDSPEIIIVPDRKSSGTNLMLINPIGAIKYDFGEWSFRKHIEQAERKKVKVKVCRCDNLTFDLDWPEDWDYLIHINSPANKPIVDNLLQEVRI
ncbi:MAG: 2-phospho-L-lactate guanylyltransferase [Proteobacteria bacterium]|nr:2-phospho-L-lactate guanylyltransferase [Pseudomonadota bacterium]